MRELPGSVALVTGAAGGIGRAVALRLAADGARVVVADIDAAGGARTAADVDGLFVRCDVAVPADCIAAVQAALEHTGGLDLVHLNAGVSTGCGVGEDFDPAAYRRAVAINLDGVVFGVHAALPALRAGGGGAIVVTASLAGLTAVPADPIYAATKHAVVGLVRSLGLDEQLRLAGITVNAVCPGFADTAIIEPLRTQLAGYPLLSPDDVAEAVVLAATSGASGQAFPVQVGREVEAYRFRGVPGPRAPG